MLPTNTASSIAFGGLYYAPDERVTTPIVDYERGGVAMGDSSQGLLVKSWKAWFDNPKVWLQGDGDETATLLLEDGFITELSLCFDQNMRWSIAYVSQGVLKLNWFDTYLGARVNTIIPGAPYNPKMGLDDKRPLSLQTSDMILAYLKGDGLFYRQQRDRFQIEYTLRTGLFPGTKLKNIGMNKNMRMQFELV